MTISSLFDRRKYRNEYGDGMDTVDIGNRDNSRVVNNYKFVKRYRSIV